MNFCLNCIKLTIIILWILKTFESKILVSIYPINFTFGGSSLYAILVSYWR